MHTEPERYCWQVKPEEAGRRLDVFLFHKSHELSRSAAARVIREGAVKVSGRRVKSGLVLQAGDAVEYLHFPPRACETRPENLPLDILYEDNHLAIVVKPAGMVTHPAPGHKSGTLVNALLYKLSSLSGVGGQQRPGIVHRLDQGTSGILLVAKNDRAHHALTLGIQQRLISRIYEALVWGRIEENEFVVETRLGRDPGNRTRFKVVSAKGKLAITRFHIARRFNAFTHLRLFLDTGRTHQIRIHCKHLGTPIVGDREYGKRGEAGQLARWGIPRPGRQMLHAGRVEFKHPFTGKDMVFQAPWPEDFEEIYQALCRKDESGFGSVGA